MALVIDMSITALGSLNRIEQLVITRQEELENVRDPFDEVHTYKVALNSRHGTQSSTFVKHRYGDGGWVLTMKAIQALELDQIDMKERLRT